MDQTLAGKYAIATVNAIRAKRNINLDKVKMECDLVLGLLVDQRIKKMIINPAIETLKKEYVICKLLESKVTPEIMECTKLLLKNNRASSITDVMQKIKLIEGEDKLPSIKVRHDKVNH